MIGGAVMTGLMLPPSGDLFDPPSCAARSTRTRSCRRRAAARSAISKRGNNRAAPAQAPPRAAEPAGMLLSARPGARIDLPPL